MLNKERDRNIAAPQLMQTGGPSARHIRRMHNICAHADNDPPRLTLQQQARDFSAINQNIIRPFQLPVRHKGSECFTQRQSRNKSQLPIAGHIKRRPDDKRRKQVANRTHPIASLPATASCLLLSRYEGASQRTNTRTRFGLIIRAAQHIKRMMDEVHVLLRQERLHSHLCNQIHGREQQQTANGQCRHHGQGSTQYQLAAGIKGKDRIIKIHHLDDA